MNSARWLNRILEPTAQAACALAAGTMWSVVLAGAGCSVQHDGQQPAGTHGASAQESPQNRANRESGRILRERCAAAVAAFERAETNLNSAVRAFTQAERDVRYAALARSAAAEAYQVAINAQRGAQEIAGAEARRLEKLFDERVARASAEARAAADREFLARNAAVRSLNVDGRMTALRTLSIIQMQEAAEDARVAQEQARQTEEVERANAASGRQAAGTATRSLAVAAEREAESAQTKYRRALSEYEIVSKRLSDLQGELDVAREAYFAAEVELRGHYALYQSNPLAQQSEGLTADALQYDLVRAIARADVRSGDSRLAGEVLRNNGAPK